MNIVLLNWSGAENDAFNKINLELKLSLELFGVNVNIIDSEGELAQKLFLINNEIPIDGVITHQGLCSNLQTIKGTLIWEELQIKLLCLHSDHPSIQPNNHISDSRYVLHSYCLPEFSIFANQNFEKEYLSVFLPIPNFYFRRLKKSKENLGDYFIFPKNIDSFKLTNELWKKEYPSSLYAFLYKSYREIIENYSLGDLHNHHELIDLSLSQTILNNINNQLPQFDNYTIKIIIHGLLDKAYRNYASELVISEMKDLPLKIFGRGWTSFIKGKSKFHFFEEVNHSFNYDSQFYYNYGIIDIVPNKFSLHDRTLRAIAHNSSFLSNSSVRISNQKDDPFNDLFFNGIEGQLKSKAESVMNNPELHRERCSQFGDILYSNNPFGDFVNFLENFFC